MQRWEKNTQHIPTINAWHWILSIAEQTAEPTFPAAPARRQTPAHSASAVGGRVCRTMTSWPGKEEVPFANLLNDLGQAALGAHSS